MKKIITTFVLIALFCGITANAKKKDVYIFTEFHEPALSGLRLLYSYDCLHWDSLSGSWLTPKIGNDHTYYSYEQQKVVEPKFFKQHMMRDPSITQGPDGTFHLVWTLAWQGENAFGYASSKDLIHWSEQRKIYVMRDSMTNNVWAPELFYDDEQQQFLIIWSSGIPKERWTEADKLGQNSAHRLYYTTTRDFKTFAPAKQYYDPGFNSIDAFLLKRAKNDYVLIVKDNRKPGFSDLFCAFSNSPYGPFKGDTSTKFAPTYSEGPCAMKVNDEWFIYFDSYRLYRYGAVSTRDFKTFTPIDDKISVPEGHKHGTIFKVKEKVLKKLLKENKKKH